MPFRSGRHFLQIPGPSNVPERILRAVGQPTIDHRGPEFARLTLSILDRLGSVFKTRDPVVILPSSGTGAWEAALVNTLSPGDRVLMFETGHFAGLWHQMATSLGLDVEWVAGDWRRGVEAAVVEEKLTRGVNFKAVMVVHNETSTGVTTDIGEIRKAMDRSGHPALLMVDTISSLASIDYRHDEWGVDVSVAGSQKGLMLPPGLGFNAVSKKALTQSRCAQLKRSYLDWAPILEANQQGFFPYTPATNLLFGLNEALDMLLGEGMANVFARHARLGEATRRAVDAWGLELQCLNRREYSNSLTAVRLPGGHDAEALREIILDRFDMSLGTGLGKVKGKVFRIGHLGDFNDLMLAGALCGVEMGLQAAGVPHDKGGVDAAMDYLNRAAGETVKTESARAAV
jgi:alanine-glyoxylate transaminase/serine-glyoxylate transaminase/serine-pyruvate transaminase